jgi:ABC-type multidrug transport system fused ATPase/permease subunit
VSVSLRGYWFVMFVCPIHYTTQDTLSVGELVVFCMLTQRMLWPLTRLGLTLDNFERSNTACMRTFELLSRYDVYDMVVFFICSAGTCRCTCACVIICGRVRVCEQATKNQERRKEQAEGDQPGWRASWCVCVCGQCSMNSLMSGIYI